MVKRMHGFSSSVALYVALYTADSQQEGVLAVSAVPVIERVLVTSPVSTSWLYVCLSCDCLSCKRNCCKELWLTVAAPVRACNGLCNYTMGSSRAALAVTHNQSNRCSSSAAAVALATHDNMSIG